VLGGFAIELLEAQEHHPNTLCDSTVERRNLELGQRTTIGPITRNPETARLPTGGRRRDGGDRTEALASRVQWR